MIRALPSEDRGEFSASESIERPRLIERLAVSAKYPVTLLIAPVGYGFAETRDGTCCPRIVARARARTDHGHMGEARHSVRREPCEARSTAREERLGHDRADWAEAGSRSSSRFGAAAGDCCACNAQSVAHGADLGGLERVPQLRCEARSSQTLILRPMPDRRREVQPATSGAFATGGPAKIAEIRAAGRDPTQTPEVQRRRAATASQQRKAAVAWRDDGSLGGVDSRRDILPKLQSLPVRVIAEAMGANISHGSKVRGGKLVPHKRHWRVLIDLVAAQA